jgi:ADP-heptose:LPS heptosyltransferase
MRGSKLLRSLDTVGGQAAIALLSLLPGARRERATGGDPRRIVVVKLAAMGDTVLMVPALRALRQRYPAAEIAMLGTAVNREIAAEYPQYVDRFVCLEVGRVAREPAYLARFVRALRREGWELAVDFDQWAHLPPLLLRLAGVPVRVGFRTPSRLRHRLYSRTRPRDPCAHEARNFASLLGALGIEVPELRLELGADPALRARFRQALAAEGWNGADPVVLVHPGCGHAHARAWPVERYEELVRRVGDGAFFVLTGADAERELAERLAAAAPGRSLAPRTASLRELIAWVSLADLVVSGNTGTMHLAAALGRPQVVLEGPNDPAKWGALNDRAVVIRSDCPGCPCLDMGWEFHRTDGYCMGRIATDDVAAAVSAQLALLAGHRATFRPLPAGGEAVPAT